MDDAPLWAALAQLTQPRIEDTPQRNAAGITCVVTHPPLLEDLDAAAAGATGSHAGTVAAGLDSTRLPGNWAAIALRDDVRRWCGAATPAAVTWWAERQHAAWLHRTLSDRDYAAAIAHARGWADRIRALFDPPTTVPLELRCPECGARWGQEPTHGDRVDAVAVMYSLDGEDVPQKVWAECRAILPATDVLMDRPCGAVWDGRDGVRALMDEAHVSDRLGFPVHRASDAQLADVAVVCQPLAVA